MGMDVSGRNPTTEAGGYFRASVWSWPDIIAAIEATGTEVPVSWCFNDGAGYEDQASCTELADKIDDLLLKEPILVTSDNPNTATIRKMLSGALKEVVDQTEEDGVTREVVTDSGLGIQITKVPRHAYEETGALKGRPHEVSLQDPSSWVNLPEAGRPADLVHIADFSKFLRGCGGFEIW